MISNADIRAALFQPWITNTEFGLSTAYPNVEFTPDKTTPWARLTVNPTAPINVEVGATLTEQFTGIMDIEIYYPASLGDGDAIEKADQVISVYKRAANLTSGTASVRIENAFPVEYANIDGYFRVHLQVNWFSFQCQS